MVMWILAASEIWELNGWKGTVTSLMGKKQLAKSGASIYYQGGGWWRISGYAHDNDDIKALKRIMLQEMGSNKRSRDLPV